MVTAPAIGYWYGFTGTCCCVCVGATSSGVNVAVSQHPMPGYGTPATHPMIGLHCTPLSISTGQLAGGFDKSVFKLCDNEAPPSAGVANGCPVCGSMATADATIPDAPTCAAMFACCCTANAFVFTHCGLAVSITFVVGTSSTTASATGCCCCSAA